MKKSLIDIFTRSQHDILRRLILLTFLILIVLMSLSFLQYKKDKMELINFIRAKLNYDTILPLEEYSFLQGLQKSTNSFDYHISNTNKVKVCSRNNCYSFNFSKLFYRSFLPTLILLILNLIFIVLFYKSQKKSLSLFQSELLNMKKVFEGVNLNTNNVMSFELESIIESYLKIKALEEAELKNTIYYNISRQIAHDIRSPLEALKSISSNLDSLNFSTKQIITNSIGRISDIANDLLRSSPEIKKKSDTCNLRLVIEDVIRDKEFEYDFNINYKVYDLYSPYFIIGQELNLFRSISNLINNGIEAQEKNNTKIDVTLSQNNKTIRLVIRDYGKGMSKQLIAKALKGGHTTKEQGNGLGLSFANTVIKEHGGNLEIESKESQGTKIIITLNAIPAPGWFIDTLFIKDETSDIVCIDDDRSFLNLYKNKFATTDKNILLYSEKELHMIHFSENSQFFIDHILNSKTTGLEYILNNQLEANSILVTSMYHDKYIQSICLKHNIKILPKQIFNSVQVVMQNDEVDTTIIHEETKKYVFIDDDYLIHMSWQMDAKKNNIKIDCYFSIDEFLENQLKYNRSTPIFIDSNLKNGIKGEIESEKIALLGFQNIYLATGYSPEDLDKPEWIKKIVGKRFFLIV